MINNQTMNILDYIIIPLIENDKKENDKKKNLINMITEYGSIIYPIRIHKYSNCTCERFMNNSDAFYIIENLYYYNEFSNYPKYFYIKKSEEEANYFLSFLLFDTIKLRDDIRLYFLNNKINEESRIIREKVKQINNKSISYCMKYDGVSEDTANGGFAIMGTKKQMDIIASIFNTYCEKTEISKILVYKIKDLYTIPSYMRSYNLKLFMLDLNNINKNLYIIIGELSKPKYEKVLYSQYSLSFGKREFLSFKFPELSKECALRELFEEFNIQFSNKLIENNDLSYIHEKYCIIYNIYLSESTEIGYYKKGDIIYLD